jgi:hypothetical protein
MRTRILADEATADGIPNPIVNGICNESFHD